MRRLLVLLCCSCSTLCAQKMEWKHDLGEARDSAYAQPAFLLVYVEQRYQSESEKMDLRTWSDASVIARAARFVCVRIDVADPIRGTLLGFADFANAFMTRHKVTDLPTTLVLDPAEGQVARSAGYTTAEEMRTLLDSLPSGLAPLYGILKEVAANDDAVRPRIAAAE